MLKTISLACCVLWLMSVSAAGAEMSHGHTAAGEHAGKDIPPSEFDRQQALDHSQSAIGNTLGDYKFRDNDGNVVSLDSYSGKPLVISLIYTSCYHICPTTTQHLLKVVESAREVLGDESFNVISVGFDVLVDTPPMMNHFARQQDVDLSNWQFLSSDKATIDLLVEDLGFIYFPSPNGFDHLIQTTLINQTGKVISQIYGMEFDMPLLIDPLKQLVFSGEGGGVTKKVSDRILLFCTVYDPASNKYRFDYSLFIGTFIGLMCVLFVGTQLFREWRLKLRS
jgi:protein SCO1